ncbi:helix-turn-helix transcriptional regulator [Paenibacillus bovis]|uniref:Transcriptional regulator n=1 Tax=Paenibacillus bovis TaxID=1616788 RepID=A0A172ZH97_9BACL|nr:transcriptional regulator [Paenibacillus bovis]ANF96657.1 transcriptional regulator [Paenibacillus bovis]
MRADRLLRILLLLQNEGQMTTRQLSKTLEVSARTIVRDMDALSTSGIPVYAERGSQGGWKLTEGYRTRLTGIKPEELGSLLLSSHPQLLADLGIQQYFDDALQKLLAALPANAAQTARMIRSKIHIDGAGWHEHNDTLSQLMTIQEALFTEQKLKIRYQRNNEMAERILCPLGLVAKRSVWYVIARVDDPGQEMRTYRVSNIAEAIMLEQHFTPPSDFNLQEYWEQSTRQFKNSLPRYPARIRVCTTILPQLEKERYIRIDAVQPCADQSDWYELDVQFATLEHACSMMLGCGGSAIVLSPEELRQHIVLQAASIQANYNF